MSIQVESTNTSLEADKARTASAQKPEVENTQSASSESEESDLHDENSEASDISEKTDEDEADSTESEDDEGLKDETKEDKPKKESNKLAKRLKKLSSERTQARLDADQARREAEFLRSELQKAKSTDQGDQSKVQENPKVEGEPNPDDFDTNAAYIKAFTKWEIANEKVALAKESQQAQLKNDYQKQLEKHNERVNQFKSKQSDYEQVVSDFIEDRGNVKFSPALEDAILSSDLGPAIFYELAKDLEKFDRLNSMNGNQALLEVGKILARLESSSEKNKKPEVKVTKAPAPISPIGNGSATVAKSLNDPNISFPEYEQIRMKQLKKQ